ncbi:MAG: phytoene/squalene synthase family protein [Planctomycetaceae bacterium]|nr:phytoene/squalene synthase family protein [Planctomycetaceae bacterium]
MFQLIAPQGASSNWTAERWEVENHRATQRALAGEEGQARKALTRLARGVLRRYSSSFFMVTRFLPPAKRAQVELIYAAVRYPDEVVDTFALSPGQKRLLLSGWRQSFMRALASGSMLEALRQGLPAILAGFAQVVRETAIPPRHYHAFVDAMEADIEPRRYATLADLTENYIYGSAIVVGYFLAHVYGASAPAEFPRVMEVSRRLGIALQLTNFLRDVVEDRGRGRLYLPQDVLRAEGLFEPDLVSPRGREAMGRVLARLGEVARMDYAFARDHLRAFAPDSQPAIKACIEVYGLLNEQVSTASALHRRQSVSAYRKFLSLPASKYWRLPLAYLGAI